MKEYKGYLAGFPEEVVEWMLDQQEAQGNTRDVSVFETDLCQDNYHGGFDFDETIEGVGFCEDVIQNRKFERFFKLYPKKTETIPIHTTEVVETKREPSKVEVVTQIVCALITVGFYTPEGDVVKDAIDIADEIFKQCNAK